MPDIGLTPQQLAVICALSSGVTTLSAADQAGVHRNTFTNWRRNSMPFQRALAEAQYDRALYFREKVEAEVDLAIQTLHHLLADPKTPASVRLKAALAVIQTASTPPLPKKQIELVMQTIGGPPTETHNDAQPAPPRPTKPVSAEPADKPAVHPSNQPLVHNPAQPDPPVAPQSRPQAIVQELPKSAQPAQPGPPTAHNSAQPLSQKKHKLIARNAQCPCGSGKKYKRCCLAPESPLATAA